jgi:hypothetical protein
VAVAEPEAEGRSSQQQETAAATLGIESAAAMDTVSDVGIAIDADATLESVLAAVLGAPMQCERRAVI